MSELKRQHQAHMERVRKFFPQQPKPRPLFIVVEPDPPPIPMPMRIPKGYHFPINEVTYIAQVTAHHFGMACGLLLSSDRHKEVVRPRQIAMFLARATGKKMPEIGRRIGGRDHTTVLHGVQVIEELVKTDWTVAWDVASIEIKLELAKRT